MALSRRTRTAWHPLLVLLLRELLPEDSFVVQGEFQLTSEPLRVDIVLLRKLAAGYTPPLLHSLLDDLPEHTLVHFKGPTDRLAADDATKLLVYALLYLEQAHLDEPVQLGLRILASEATEDFWQRLLQIGVRKGYRGNGVWEAALGPFALRVVEADRGLQAPGEHLLAAFSRWLLEHRGLPAPLSKQEFALYQGLYQQIAKFRREGDALMYKDLELAEAAWLEVLRKTYEMFSPEDKAAVLKNLTPEQVGAALGREGTVLALPDDLLGLMPDEALATLSPEARAQVRRRIGR